MDIFPDLQLQGPPSQAPPPSTPPPIGSPPSSNSSFAPPPPPPSSPSPPPRKQKAPPPTTNAPPPSPPSSNNSSTPTSPPPDSPPSDSPPPSENPPPPPSKKSPPPKSSPSSPPPPSHDSPPPTSSPPPPANVASPPPQNVTPSPPQVTPPPARAPPGPTGSPPSPPPSPTTTNPPPHVNSTSPPAPPSYVHSPPANSSTPSGSVPRPSSSSGTPGSNASANSVPPKANQSDRDHSVRTGVAVVAVIAFIIIGFMLVMLFLQRRKKRRDRYNSVYVVPSPFTSTPASGTSFLKQTSNGGDNMNASPEGGGLGNPKTWFTYEELTKATNGFASQNILGTGGFGCVYKGCLQDGQEVAVKKLKDNSGQGEREFKAEVEIITRVHHRHLVSLVGCCISDHQKLLVYEYVPNNTLHHHLHAPNIPVMQWGLRVKVTCGSARGIAYLHEDCSPRIIHRDIKSANILLDNNFDAKVADFGLAKLAQELESHSHVSTRVMGTFGYMAPEYASSGKLTEKSDVFSFGVVLLEIITGRKPVDETRPLGDESLVEWARPLMSEALESQNVDELADPRLEGNYDRGEMFRMIEAAAACVRHSATKRPKMTQLVRELATMSDISDLNNGMKPGQSAIYDSREQSAQIRMFERMTFGSQEFSPEYYHDSQGSWTSKGRSGQF